MVWENVVNALIGIWFIIAPAVLQFSSNQPMTWTSVIGGLILLVLAGSASLNLTARRQSWIQVVNGLVGIWFIIAPWVLSFTGRAGDFWTSLILGIEALILSIWNLYIVSEPPVETRQHAH